MLLGWGGPGLGVPREAAGPPTGAQRSRGAPPGPGVLSLGGSGGLSGEQGSGSRCTPGGRLPALSPPFFSTDAPRGSKALEAPPGWPIASPPGSSACTAPAAAAPRATTAPLPPQPPRPNPAGAGVPAGCPQLCWKRLLQPAPDRGRGSEGTAARLLSHPFPARRPVWDKTLTFCISCHRRQRCKTLGGTRARPGPHPTLTCKLPARSPRSGGAGHPLASCTEPQPGWGGGCKRGRCPPPGRELVATGLGRGRWAMSPPHAQRIPSRLLRLRHRLRVRPSVHPSAGGGC